MPEKKEINMLGTYVTMVLLNNRLYRNGRISEDMKNRISGELLSEYQRSRAV